MIYSSHISYLKILLINFVLDLFLVFGFIFKMLYNKCFLVIMKLKASFIIEAWLI